MAKTRRVVRRGSYRMTSRRKAALHKAQLVSARKRSRAARLNVTTKRRTTKKGFNVKITSGQKKRGAAAIAGGVLGAAGTAYVAHKGYKKYGGTIVSISGYHDTYGKTFNGVPRSPAVGIRRDRTLSANTGPLKRGQRTPERRHFITVRPPTIGGYTIRHPSGGWVISTTVRSPQKARKLYRGALAQQEARRQRTTTVSAPKVDRSGIAPYNPYAQTGWRSTPTRKQREKLIIKSLMNNGMSKKDAKRLARKKLANNQTPEFPPHIPARGRRHTVVKAYK